MPAEPLCRTLKGSEASLSLCLVQSAKGMLPACTAMLFRAVCSVLDENASTGLLATFSVLLGDVPSLDDCVGSTPGMLASGRVHFLLPSGPWGPRFRTKQAWEQVGNKLLPALSEACEGLASNTQQQEGIFRDVAVSAWTCCNPGCTNMAGQQEASWRSTSVRGAARRATAAGKLTTCVGAASGLMISSSDGYTFCKHGDAFVATACQLARSQSPACMHRLNLSMELPATGQGTFAFAASAGLSVAAPICGHIECP